MRIRTVKPSFWSSEDMARLSDQALLLAIGLLNFADDEGYFSTNVALIRAALFPLRKTPAIDGLLTQLASVGYIEMITGSDGRRYGRICKFRAHQRINRPCPSAIALLCCGDTAPPEPSVSPHGTLSESSVSPHKALSESSVNAHAVLREPSVNVQGALTEPSPPERKGREEERRQERKAALARTAEVESGFAEFWQAYPRKDSRIEARKAFEKVDVEIAILLKAIAWQRRQEEWLKDGGRYIPHAATWLNKRRWEDEPRLHLPGIGITPARQAANDGRHYPGPQRANVVTIPDDV